MNEKSTTKSKQSKPIKKLSPLNIIGSIIIVILLGVITFLGFQYYENSKELDKLDDPYYLYQLQVDFSEAVLEDISKIMILPDGEPTVLNIDDVESLKVENPEFYDNSKNGDMIVIYPDVAIIYRPGEKLIVNVAPVITEDIEGLETE